MTGKPISIITATDMIVQFGAYVKKLQTDPNKKTEYVFFSLPELMTWLKQIEPYADELKVCMGLYPQDAPDPGRLTVILWPYKAGQPSAAPIAGKDGGGGGGLDPYNDGNSGP